MTTSTPARYNEETLSLFRERDRRFSVSSYIDLTVEGARDRSLKVAEYFSGDQPFDGNVSEIHVPSDDVKDGIPVTVYKPSVLPDRPAIVIYFHGGGWVVGCRESYDATCRRIAGSVPCIVLSVEYRLAPEFKFPACNKDARCVVQWVLQNREKVGGCTASAVGVAGDSAGGAISATVCYEVSEIKFQILVYPKVDTKNDRPSSKEFPDCPILPEAIIVWFFEQWLTTEDYNDPGANPLHRTPEDKLPPALIIAAECDPIRDDSYDYEKKLKSCGVHTEFLLVPGVCHGFFGFVGHFQESCKAPYKAIEEFIKKYS